MIALLLFGGAARAAQVDLYVNYTTNCSFALVGDNGAPVSSVASGSYQLVVQTPFDFAAGGATCDHVDFQIAGPGVSFTTTLGGGDADDEQYTLALQPNATYVLQDTEAAATRLTLTTTSAVGGSTGSTTSTGSSSSSSSSTKAKGSTSQDVVGSALLPLRGTLVAAVVATGRQTLSFQGRAVSSLKAGRYTITVKDSSKTAGFTLQEIHKAAQSITGKGMTGSRKLTVTLRAGQWYFYSPGGTKHYFFVLG